MYIIMRWIENETSFLRKVICIKLPVARPLHWTALASSQKDSVFYIESCNAARASLSPQIYCEALIFDAVITASHPAIMGRFQRGPTATEISLNEIYCTLTNCVFVNFCDNCYVGGFWPLVSKEKRATLEYQGDISHHWCGSAFFGFQVGRKICQIDKRSESVWRRGQRQLNMNSMRAQQRPEVKHSMTQF